LCFLDLIVSEYSDQIWQEMFLAIMIAGLSAYACMGLFTRLVDRTGMMPFVIYRILLGTLLLYLYFYVV
jgi:undecaprenyl-diphosphatase